MKIYNLMFPILSKYRIACFISRYIVHFLKKFKLEIEDHHRGQIQMLIYGLRETEWKNLLLTVEDEEIEPTDNFIHVVETKHYWKGIKLGVSDLPWMLRQNRYRINKICSGNWYYVNGRYFFEYLRDKKAFEKIALKYSFLGDK